MADRKVLHTITISSFAVLLLALVLPIGTTGRILAAILLAPIAALTLIFIKKRSILSLNKQQVLMLLTVIALLYVMLYYLTGLEFGLYRSGDRLNLHFALNFILPITVIIVATELIRYVVRAQNSKLADLLCYASCVIAEVLICANLTHVTTFNKFMDVVGIALFPAIISNLLYHYISKRYGFYPNIVYRLITSLYMYVIPYQSAIPDALLAFANLLVPILIYLFIDALYEKKRRYALEKKSKFSVIITVLAVAIMASVIMLISNQFRFGALVIATESMTGELNKGDTAIFEQYTDQIILEGQVIVFERDGSTVVHRVVDIKKINGETQYYTQGDANEDPDAGYVTDNQVVGLVSLKIPYIGYPTIWIRSLFSH